MNFFLATLLVTGLFYGCGGGSSHPNVTFGSGPTGSPTANVTVTTVTPSSGPTTGSTQVIITGTNFASTDTVTFGGTAATSLVFNSSTSLTVTTPIHSAAGPVDVVVTDSTGQSGTLTGGFTYTAPGQPPNVTPLQITTNSLPSTTLGVSYSQQIVVTGGSGTKTFTISSGSLPSGLMLGASTGLISGAASQTGTFPFTVQVTDSSGSVSQQYSISVNNTLPGGQIALIDCNTILTSNHNYQLQNDISAPGTCLSVQGHDIVLDLNGHTITYFTAATTNQSRFGILAEDCFDVTALHLNLGNPCMNGNSDFSNITIVGNMASPSNPALAGANTGAPGKIVQGAGAAGSSFSHAIRVGQGQTVSGLTVHDVDITVSADSSFGIYTNFSKGGGNIYNNTIHNNVTTIQDRQHFDGMSIKLDDESAATIPNMIHHNMIIGGAQAGIRESNPSGSKLFNNDISQSATYTNDFCIDSLGANVEIYNNNCHPTMGRGIHVASNNVNLHDNTISVIERSMNQEYGAPITTISRLNNIVTVTTSPDINAVVGNTVVIIGTGSFDGTYTVASAANPHTFTFNSAGANLALGAGGNASGCQIHGTYGIQVESDQVPSGTINIFNNNVTATADECDAQGLKMTTILSNTNLNIHDNTFTAKRIGSTTARAIGVAVDAFDGLNSTLFNNTFVTDTEAILIDFDGGNNLKLTNNTFTIGTNPVGTWQMFDFQNFAGGGPSSNNVVQDPTYQNGASDLNNHVPASAVTEDALFKWTVLLQVIDSANANVPISGATVTVTDATAAQVFSGTTDVNGEVSPILIEKHLTNTGTTTLTPHSFTVTKAGCTTLTFSQTVDAANLPPPGTPIVKSTHCP